MTMQYNDMPVKRVTVTAYVEFDAYVYAENGGEEWDPSPRVESDLIDAITYRTGYGADAEDGDAIVAVGDRVVVDAAVRYRDSSLTSEALENLILGRHAEAHG